MQDVRSLLEHAIQDVDRCVVSLLQRLHFFYLVKLHFFYLVILHHYKPRTVLFVGSYVVPFHEWSRFAMNDTVGQHSRKREPRDKHHPLLSYQELLFLRSASSCVDCIITKRELHPRIRGVNLLSTKRPICKNVSVAWRRFGGFDNALLSPFFNPSSSWPSKRVRGKRGCRLFVGPGTSSSYGNARNGIKERLYSYNDCI